MFMSVKNVKKEHRLIECIKLAKMLNIRKKINRSILCKLRDKEMRNDLYNSEDVLQSVDQCKTKNISVKRKKIKF